MSVLGVPESDEPRMLDLTQKLFGAEDPDFGVGADPQARMAVMMDFVGYFHAHDRRPARPPRRRPRLDDRERTHRRRAAPRSRDHRLLRHRRDRRTRHHVEHARRRPRGARAPSRAAPGAAARSRRDRQRRRRDDPLGHAGAALPALRAGGLHAARPADREGRRAPDVVPLGEPRRGGVRRSVRASTRPRANASSHLAFGTGVHFCLGANLARMELRTFFRELLPRLESLELTGPARVHRGDVRRRAEARCRSAIGCASRDWMPGRLQPSPTRLSASILAAYGGPVFAVGYLLFFVQFYFLKFATDVLLLSPAVVSLLFGAAKLWDGVSGPLIGSLSDRTRTRWGRRRPFLFGSLPLLALGFVMLWMAPRSLEGGWLIAWLGGCAVPLLQRLRSLHAPAHGARRRAVAGFARANAALRSAADELHDRDPARVRRHPVRDERGGSARGRGPAGDSWRRSSQACCSP